MIDFHFLRPDWLWALVPAILLPLALYRAGLGQHGWQRHIERDFLPYLQASSIQKSNKSSAIIGITSLLVLTVLALAGPAWEKKPVPVEQRGDALILVVDLSLSMFAEDVSPSRISRVKMKLLDILKARQEGTTALVVYAGDAHVVTPLSDDSDTIAAMVPALSPDIMPALGSRVDLAVEKALQLADHAGTNAPSILLLSDGITEDDVTKIRDILSSSDAVLGILGIGTEAGGPVPLPGDQGLLRNRDGSIAVPKLSRNTLTTLAEAANGIYRDLSLDDQDWQALLKHRGEEQSQKADERQFDQWIDRGALLSLVIMMGMLPLFRRGIIFAIVFAMPMVHSPSSWAGGLWDNLWQRPDQQGAKLLQQEDYNAAAEAFDDPEWQAIAHYKAGQFDEAEKQLAAIRSERAFYNRGNALAKAGQLDDAIKAYEQALAINPDNEDAAFNKSLVEQLKQQQSENQNEQQQSDSQNEQQQDSKDSDSQDQQNTDSQNQSDSTTQDPNNQEPTPEQNSDQNPENSSENHSDRQQNDPAANSENDQPMESEEQQQSSQEPLSGDDQQAAKEPLNASTKDAFEDLSDEERQTMEQWLRQIPDDPGGLLRRKFRYQYEQRRLNGQDEVPETWY